MAVNVRMFGIVTKFSAQIHLVPTEDQLRSEAIGLLSRPLVRLRNARGMMDRGRGPHRYETVQGRAPEKDGDALDLTPFPPLEDLPSFAIGSVLVKYIQIRSIIN